MDKFDLINHDKIPTAEEFLKNKLSEIHEEEIFEDLLQRMFTVDVSEALIEFAKLYVEAALKEASENIEFVQTTSERLNSENYKPFITADDNTIWTINKESILNAYPLENIK